MSKLKDLKNAKSLTDLAKLLGFKPKALAYILYVMPKELRYAEFEIPKRTGGLRKISAPCSKLKKLQKNLSDLLLICCDELHSQRESQHNRKIYSAISHGFVRKKSIITNAANHRSRRYVFNLDLNDFFGTITFPRIRGFFIENKNFNLDPTVATLIAQIACNNDALPQGSPSSPVISNLLAHILDIRIVALVSKVGCTYSRYADDLTFSTNKNNFPEELAKFDDVEKLWSEGEVLRNIVNSSGYKINSSKTRMQEKRSRQEVTGLIVNSKVNSRVEYRKSVRAMAYSLFETGKFHRNISRLNDEGKIIVIKELGKMSELNGMLNFVDMLSDYNRGKDRTSSVGNEHLRKEPRKMVQLNTNERIYRDFLFYKYFYSSDTPTIICEGKTDYVYLQCAIRKLHQKFPMLAGVNASGKIEFKIKFFRFSALTSKLFGLSGGATQLKQFIIDYDDACSRFKAAGLNKPVIVVLDNDAEAKPIYSLIKNYLNINVDGSELFYEYKRNLYIVATPLLPGLKETMIENCFSTDVTEKILSGKKFSWANDYKKDETYGKKYLAEYVVKKSAIQ
ncbi:retron Ec67 family RNA-directed DNA polymerase/endonuclease [Rugamonas sp. CCM 8940]|uniref:retron Ec67 family RNA-directed DNA polymerase/endonuclease n=1 Tax=Rugamonas sp. CCM 8940 TaxID=2765359 RepID=UPI0018F29F3A|nr:retron Ec67 family RNA-directed DNA polymerase/endonuclease [Rugamonas sp. CCM 8940]MBJ7313258.1 retron Ec67 family RNA-directed DNA polymerase/endonuclease [Rugamonas sp. CCM 8940]